MDNKSFTNDLDEKDSELLVAGEKIFTNIATNWNLDEEHIAKILSTSSLAKERLLVISAILGIHKSLRIVFGNQVNCYSWIHRPNDIFDGQTALEFMCERGSDGVFEVNRYLQAQTTS